MADPTLISNVSAYSGFTLDQITERLLASRGMTLDSTTMRTPVIATESTDAYNRIRRSFSLFVARFPGVYTIQKYNTTWTLNDTMLALAANLRDIVYVEWDGRPLRRINRLMRQNIHNGRDASSNAQVLDVAGDPLYYDEVGLANVGTASAPDYRLVIEILPHPSTSKTLTVCYNAKAPALPSTGATDKDDPLPINEPFQEWVLRRAQELWAADEGDQVTREMAMQERANIELDIDEMIDANMDAPSVILPEYPTAPSSQRRR